MNADDFSHAIALCPPSIEAMMRMHPAASFAFCTARHASYFTSRLLPPKPLQDPLEDFAFNFKHDALNISSISFGIHQDLSPSTLQTVASLIGTPVGSEEGDILCIAKDTGEVVVVEYAAPSYVISTCAVDGSHFLDAAHIACRYLAHITVEAYKNSDGSEEKVQALRCTEAAGGLHYYSFWSAMVGVF